MIDDVNHYPGMLYWIDGGKHTIEQIDYIGNNHKVLLLYEHMFKIDGESVPAFGLALHNDNLYFSPWGQTDGIILAIDRQEPNKAIKAISRGISAKPFGMAVVFEFMQEEKENERENFCKPGQHRCTLCMNDDSDKGQDTKVDIFLIVPFLT
jgi:hypothetical protein